eukprot:1429336-Rhodomonas_salina.1
MAASPPYLHVVDPYLKPLRLSLEALRAYLEPCIYIWRIRCRDASVLGSSASIFGGRPEAPPPSEGKSTMEAGSCCVGPYALSVPGIA